MKIMVTVILLLALQTLPSYARQRRGGSGSLSKVPLAQIESVVRNGFGFKVKVESQLGAEPFYLLGDFNGDGFSDIAVLVNIEEARADLKNYGVRYINTDPYSRQNGLQIDPLSHDLQNCLGLAIIHGSSAGWDAPNPQGKYMTYECFSSFRLVRKGERIRRGSGSSGPTPVPKGDSIFLSLETGGTALLYWNGKTYRGFGIRIGD
jgi:hypothetical protein